MGHRLFAVLIHHTATVDTVNLYLHPRLNHLRGPGTFDDYRLGGQATGAWDPDYDPTLDPANWRTCHCCDGTAPGCPQCRDAARDGRPAGTILAPCWDWRPHPGDLVPLPRLLDPAWRFPRRRTPIAWVDHAGLVWLDTDLAVLTGTDGDMPPRLALILEHLITHRRHLPQFPSFDAADWSVAVVDTHH